jgi:PAS domain S-box-containing protein
VEPAAAASAAQPAGLLNLSAMKHILIVEDEAGHVELIQRALLRAETPFQFTQVTRLEEARQVLEQAVPDLALVDYRLPDGNGDELVQIAAGRFPVILLTAFGNERTAVEVIKAGAQDYVVKSPETFAEIAHLVARSLREWQNSLDRKKAEARLEAINELLATMGADFTENVRRLVTLLAREIGAQFAFYSQINGPKLRTVAEWRVAEHLPGCVICGCAACTEILNYAAGHLLHVREAQIHPQAESIHLCSAPTHTQLGQVIHCQHQPAGIICLYFDKSYQPSAADRRLLGIFAAALSAEENRRHTDAELRASDERYRQIVQTAHEGIWVTDEHDLITFVNQRLAEMLGYATDEMRNHQVSDFIDKAELPGHEIQRQLGRNGQSSQFERRLRHKDGHEFWAWVSGSPLFDNDGNYRGAFAMLTDINERRQLESQLRQVQKLESIGQLAGGVAHDFNNILAAIMMHLSLLHQNPSLDAETVESLKELEVETKRAANLTRQLLMFSRRSVMQVRLLDLNEVVQNLLKMLRRLLGEHITIRFESHSELPSVEADAGMMEQILLNLAVNARDAMPKGGSVSITTNVVEFDSEVVKLNSERRMGRFVSLSVSDTGVGMDEGTLKRIFEPFFTTKEVGKGTGLGLPTVYGIIKQHQGWIEVSSRPDQGSTFEVYLPAKTESVAPSATPVATPIPRGQGTILLVEDEEIVRRPIGLYLRKLGYHVLEAANGRQGLVLWQQHRHEIDLLYTDMIMPEGMSGLDLAEKLRADKPQIKVIISSGYSTEISQQGISAQSGFVYLAKPSPSAVIADTIRNCLRVN